MKSKDILDAIGMIDDELILDAKTNVKKIKHKFILLAAVLTAFILMTTTIAVNLGWHIKLLEYLKPNEKQIQTLNNATELLQTSVSNNGVTVTVKQTLADKFGIYVLYEVTAPEDFEFNDDIAWILVSLDFPHEQSDDYIVAGTCSQIVLEQNKNKRVGLIYYETNTAIQSGKMSLYLKDLYDFDTPVINGDWQLEWDFTYKDTGKNIDVNDKTGNSTIKNIYISPMSLCVYIDGNISENMLPIINFKDGSQLRYSQQNKHLSFTNYLTNKGYLNKIDWRFENIIDLNSVDYIQIGDIIEYINR